MDIAQQMRNDISIQVFDNETEKLDCHVAGAPRNDIKPTHPNLPLKREGTVRHPELADCELRAELDGKMAKPLQTSNVDPLNASNQAVSGSQNEMFFSRFTSHFSRKRVAFTLAEVLITLGIIGVVASLTIPNLVNKYRSMVLQNQFKKSYSNLQQAVLYMKTDLGIDNLKGEFVHYDPHTGTYTNLEFFYDEFDKYFKVVKKLPRRYPMTNYSGTQTTSVSLGNDNPDPLLILSDGSSAGRRINGGTLIFSVDTNGPYKGPNRLGFDIFQFVIRDNNGTVSPYKATKKYSDEELAESPYPWVAGAPCYKDSNQQLNGIGCAWYAVNDVNPDDSTKKYWNSLPW